MAALSEEQAQVVDAIRRGDVAGLGLLNVTGFRDEFGAGAAHYAARHGQQAVLGLLRDAGRLERGGCATSAGHTPLHDAAATGNRHVAKWLCDEALCTPQDADTDGCTPVHFAARFGQLEVLRYFVTQCGCDAMATTRSGMTPLHWAACCGRVAVVKWIVKLHQRSGYERAEDGTTPVYLAAQQGRPRCLEHMVTQCSGSARIRANNGMLPIHAATAAGHYPVVKFLIQSDLASSVDLDGNNATPVHYAAANGHVELLWWLVNNHKLIPDPDRLGNSPLHDAAQYGYAECLGVLANAARLMQNEMSQLNAEDASGQTPLDIADAEEHTACSELLAMRGVQKRKKKAAANRRKDRTQRQSSGELGSAGGHHGKSPKLRRGNKGGGGHSMPPPPPPLDGLSSATGSVFAGVQLRKRDPAASASSTDGSLTSMAIDSSLFSQVKLRKVPDDQVEKPLPAQDTGLLKDIRSLDKSLLNQTNPAKRFLAPETGRVIEDDDDDDSTEVVPTTDADGKPLPDWKKKILEKKVEARKEKRVVKQLKEGEEKAKWEGIPGWKRKVMEEREAKRLADLQPELARKRMEQEKAAKVAAMPDWKRGLLNKK